MYLVEHFNDETQHLKLELISEYFLRLLDLVIRSLANL